MTPGAPLCLEHRREHGGYRRRRSPEAQLAYMRALCRVHPLTGCWEPMSGKDDGTGRGYVEMQYAETRDTAHRIVMRLTDPHLGVSWPYHPWIILHSPLCEYAYSAGLIARRCINPGHLWPGSHWENAQHHQIAGAGLVMHLHGRTDEQIVGVLREHLAEMRAKIERQEGRGRSAAGAAGQTLLDLG